MGYECLLAGLPDLKAGTDSPMKMEDLLALFGETLSKSDLDLLQMLRMTADAKFMQSVIAKLAEQMAKEGNVTIETADSEALKKYFAANAKGLIEKGVKINEVKGIKTDFAIVSEKGGYKLAFGEKEFVEYFKEFLRPQLIDLLF